MSNLILIEMRDGKHVIEHALTQLQTLIAQSGAVYTLVDKDSQTPPQELVLKRKGNILEVEVEQQLVARIEGFYDEDMAATYSLDGSLTPADGMVLGSADASVAATGAEGEVVWQAAGTESSGLTAFNIGLGASTLLGGGLALAAASGGKSDSASDNNSVSTGYELTVAAAAGPFQSTMGVEVYDKAGNLLATGEYNADTGQFKVSITNGYRGPLLVVLIDANGDAGDYLDEASNTLVSLGESLRAMAYADGGSDVHVSVTPLTELAVRISGISGHQVTEDNLAVNYQIAKLFGVSNILAPVITVLEDSYNTEDGTSEAELYGNVLALLSGVDQHSGGLFSSLAQLQNGITTQENGNLAMTQATVELLASGVDAFQSGANADKVALTQVLAQLPEIAAAAGGINALEKTAGVEVGIKGVQAGDTVTLQWGDQVYIFRNIVAEDINSAGRALLTVPGSVVEAAGDGTVAVSYHINNGAESPAVLITVDTIAPTVVITDDQVNIAIGDVTYTFTFSEDVTGFSADDVVVSGGTKGTLTGSGNTYSLVVTPERNSTNDITVNVEAAAAVDAAGNYNTAATNSIQAVDTMVPTITAVSGLDGMYAAGDTVEITLTYDEAVNVDISHGMPTLSLSDSRTAIYDSGAGTTNLVFHYLAVAASADEATLKPIALNLNSGTLQDAAGNDASTALPAATDVVVFDFITGQTSAHSGRTFSPDVDYTIYIRVDSDSRPLTALDANEWWSGSRYLDGNDLVILVGNATSEDASQDILGNYGNPVTRMLRDRGKFLAWNSQSQVAGRIEYDGGSFMRRTGEKYTAKRMFASYSVRWDSIPNAGQTLNDVYKTVMPVGILTSQGLV